MNNFLVILVKRVDCSCGDPYSSVEGIEISHVINFDNEGQFAQWLKDRNFKENEDGSYEVTNTLGDKLIAKHVNIYQHQAHKKLPIAIDFGVGHSE